MKIKNIYTLLGIVGVFFISSNAFADNSNFDESLGIRKNTSNALTYSKQEKENVNYLYALMDKGNYDTAQKFIKTKVLSNTMIIGILSKYANQGNTPAMWMLGDAYNTDKDSDNTAKWIYSALLGTRIDSSLCMNKKAGGIESIYSEAFYSAVQTARAGDISSAISFAIHLQQGIPVINRKPQWVCSVVQHEKSTNNDGTINSNRWGENVKSQINKFISETTTQTINNNF